MNVLSLFDGYSGARVALDRLNIKIDNYYASEIDKYCIQVSSKNYPNIIQLGNVNNWKEWNIDFSKIDLLIAGFPCQAWSTAGKQGGINDPRGKLFFTLIDIFNHIKTQNKNLFFLFENVKMKKDFELFINDYIGVSPITINSSLVSAQNRVRNYWTNIPNVTQPNDKRIFWGDIREKGVNSEKYYYTETALQWLGRHSQLKNKLLNIFTNEDKMQMIEASHSKKYSSQRFFAIPDYPSNEQCVAAMRGRYCLNGVRQDSKMKTEGMTKQYIEFRYDNKTNCLTTVKKDNVVVPFTLPNRIPITDFFFRYITPLECERCQTLNDNYTSCVSDSQRYKMLGNGFTVDVIKHILNFMKVK